MSSSAGRPFLVLDVDDTIVATFGVGLEKCRRVAAELGLPSLTFADFSAAYGRMPFEACVAMWYPQISVATFAARYDALADELPPVPIGDLPSLLAAAREAGLGVGILTNGNTLKTTRKLATAGARNEDFDFVRTSDNTRCAKPRVSAFSALIADGVRPRDSWYVSDSAADWAGCGASGFRSVGVVAAGPTGVCRRVTPDLAVPNVSVLVGAMTHLAALPSRPADLGRKATPRAIGFDAGFTLIEDVEDPVTLVVRMFVDTGIDVTQTAAEAFAASKHWLSDFSIWADEKRIESTLISFYGEVIYRLCGTRAVLARDVVDAYVAPRNWRPCLGAAEAIQLARRAGLRVGFLSNWQTSLPAILRSTGLAVDGDSIISSAQSAVAKPSAAAFDALAQSQGVDVRDVVYVGDDPASDAAGALAAGCRAVLVPHGSAVRELSAAVRIALPEVSQPASTA